jgi:hypothetical protein
MAPAGSGWNWFADFSGVAPKVSYKPAASDLAQSALLRHLWQSFARGAATSELAPFRPAAAARGRRAGGGEDDSQSYVVNQIGKRRVEQKVGFRAGACDALLEAMGPELPRFYWAN